MGVIIGSKAREMRRNYKDICSSGSGHLDECMTVSPRSVERAK